MDKVGRNDPCPCGSGQKYKKCCLAKDETARNADLAAKAAAAAAAAKAATEEAEKAEKVDGGKPKPGAPKGVQPLAPQKPKPGAGKAPSPIRRKAV